MTYVLRLVPAGKWAADTNYYDELDDESPADLVVLVEISDEVGGGGIYEEEQDRRPYPSGREARAALLRMVQR